MWRNQLYRKRISNGCNEKINNGGVNQLKRRGAEMAAKTQQAYQHGKVAGGGEMKAA